MALGWWLHRCCCACSRPFPSWAAAAGRSGPGRSRSSASSGSWSSWPPADKREPVPPPPRPPPPAWKADQAPSGLSSLLRNVLREEKKKAMLLFSPKRHFFMGCSRDKEPDPAKTNQKTSPHNKTPKLREVFRTEKSKTSDVQRGSSSLAFSRRHSIFWRFHHTTVQTHSCGKVVSDEKHKDPFQLGRKNLKNLYEDIKKELQVSATELKEMCEYYFDGKGKAFRPVIVVLMARACNFHHNNSGEVQASQRSIAVIVEMIHTATLVHDDVIDFSNARRGKMTVNQIWGERKAVLAGDFILSAASVALARIGNSSIISLLAQALEDLVRGEFLQMGSKENENERFAHYLEKTFKKTASLIANSCKAVSVLGCPDPNVHEIAYQYGKNIGIAFQLIDDVLDFSSCSELLGKPTSADLKLGIATGPVLFACQQFPEINAMIMRRFSLPGDVQRAQECVLQSGGIQQTIFLAQRYCQEAMREISKLRPSPERDALVQLAEIVLSREK